MYLNPVIETVTERIRDRSSDTRLEYLDRIKKAISKKPNRSHLGCGNQAHAYAAMDSSKSRLFEGIAPNLGIVTAYNDMLSAHQPFADFPDIIKKAASDAGATAQVAGGVPAMCDGVTQGQHGMELSLFSRDVIALSTAVALSHNAFDAAIYLGVCDKIVPGLTIAAVTFGHLPALFLPAGPMTSGISNSEKSIARQKYALGEITRKQLMESEMAAYHGPGTCTFYGTANSNQMLMEFMGLHLPGASFVNPNTPLRNALTQEGTRRIITKTALGDDYLPIGHILDEKAFVNGIIGLMATGGSTNLVIHLTAMARAAGILLASEDFSQISTAIPLLARVYPNGLADVNHFHAAGGLGLIIGELLLAGLLHNDVKTIFGPGLENYTHEPVLSDGNIEWRKGTRTSLNHKIVRPASNPFQKSGGIRSLDGNLGKALIKISAVDLDYHCIEAPVRVFTDQDSVKQAFRKGQLNQDGIIVVRFQGPQANGMPELHGLTPTLSALLDKGFKVGLVTDGRMSGASGKVPAAIHVTPEAAIGGPIAKVRDGDILRIDAITGKIDVLDSNFLLRPNARLDSNRTTGSGRELFEVFRQQVGSVDTGASVIL